LLIGGKKILRKLLMPKQKQYKHLYIDLNLIVDKVFKPNPRTYKRSTNQVLRRRTETYIRVEKIISMCERERETLSRNTQNY